MAEKYTKIAFDPENLTWLDTKTAEAAVGLQEGTRHLDRGRTLNAILAKLRTQESGENGTGKPGRKIGPVEEAAIQELVLAAANLAKIIRV